MDLNMLKPFLLTTLSAIALALTGCGGGGEDVFEGPANGGSGGSTPTVSLGSGTGSAFQSGQIAISNASLSAGGSTSLSVSLVQSDGTLYTQSTDITFSSSCIAAGTAEIQPDSVATTTTGGATVTYVAKGCSGDDVVTATASVGSANLSASGTVTVAQAAIGSISFVSATPTNIALKGTGDSSRPESSIVVFKVLDASGGPRAGVDVNFVLNTNVGGITLTPSTAVATSDAQGLAQIVVNAGTVATSVKVTATIQSTSPQISTQSSQLTITTGIPTARNLSLAVGCYNIEGLDIDGTQTTITARLADRFQNPVPDGTAVTFHAFGAKIGAQCVTATSSTESGVCSVLFTSQENRPSNGRIPIIAMAIGEESFTDANGNGAFDTGETLFDTSEPFEDDNEDDSYQAGEFFFDFDSNGSRTAPDGNFNGVLCSDSGRCGGARSAGIGRENIVILSGSDAVVDKIDNSGNVIPLAIPDGGGAVRLWIRDVNGNPMPGGTDVSATVTGNGTSSYTLGQPSAFKVPCSASDAGAKSAATVFTFNVSETTAGSGTFTLDVKTPSGRETIVQIPVG
jgi:hypothetical protein